MRSKHFVFLSLTLASLACWPDASVLPPVAPLSAAAQGAEADHHAAPRSTRNAPQGTVLDGQLLYQLLQGEFYAHTGDPGAAYALILDAAHKTQSAELFRRAMQIALQAHSGESSLMAAKAWSAALPTSREANLYVLQILLKLNRTSQTSEPLRRYLALAPVAERPDAILDLYKLFENVSDKPLAASVVQKALGHALHDPHLGPSAWATIGRMWLHAGNPRAALVAAIKGQAFGARHERPALLALAIWTADAHHEQQAANILQKHMASQQARPEFALMYARVLSKAKRIPDAIAVLEGLHARYPEFADAWLTHGAIEVEQGQWAQASEHFQRYIQIHTNTTAPRRPEVTADLSRVYLSMSQIAEQSKDFVQAEAWLQRVDHPDMVVTAQIRRAHLMAKQGRIEEAIALIHGIPDNTEADARAKRSAEVQVLRDGGLYERARTLLTEAIAQSPQDTDLVYDLSLVAEQMGDLVTMERLLRQLITDRPDDPQAYNALGYSLADRSLRLPEARSLIVKALELAPGDPFITDSLGWAEFRMGNMAQALQLLQNAYQQKPDPEIAAHLGEVLWLMDRQQDAMKIWREGLRSHPDNAVLTKTLQRLQVAL